jgi:hypothetical protein
MRFHRALGRTVVAQGVALCLAFLIACDGRNQESNERAEPLAIKGTERLTWIQNTDSVQSLRAHGFRLYVDGDDAALADVRCNETQTNGGYECSGLLPAMGTGRHSLEIVSVFDGIESPRSAPITVVVDTSTTKVKGGA